LTDREKAPYFRRLSGRNAVQVMKYLVVFMCFFYRTLYTTALAAQSLDTTNVVKRTGQYSSEYNLFISSVKMIAALALTLVFLVAAVWMLKKLMRFNKIPGFTSGAIDVLEIRYLAPKKAIALVRVLERVFIVVFSEQTIISLGELSSEEFERLEYKQKPETSVFKNILSGFVRKKKTMNDSAES